MGRTAATTKRPTRSSKSLRNHSVHSSHKIKLPLPPALLNQQLPISVEEFTNIDLANCNLTNATLAKVSHFVSVLIKNTELLPTSIENKNDYKCGRKITILQRAVLEEAWNRFGCTPSMELRVYFAIKLGMTSRAVVVYYQNHAAALKNGSFISVAEKHGLNGGAPSSSLAPEREASTSYVAPARQPRQYSHTADTILRHSYDSHPVASTSAQPALRQPSYRPADPYHPAYAAAYASAAAKISSRPTPSWLPSSPTTSDEDIYDSWGIKTRAEVSSVRDREEPRLMEAAHGLLGLSLGNGEHGRHH